MRGLALTLLLALVFASGWTGCDRRPDPPEVVYVTVEKIVDVPADLSRDCDPVPKREDTYAEAIRLANARAASLAECTGRMRQIRALAPEAKP